MKVLWLAGNPSLYAHAKDQHGGWIGALQRELLREKDISLAVAFPAETNLKDERDGVKYYGVSDIIHPIIGYKSKLQRHIKHLSEVINDFRPDIIHVFGSEIAFGLVSACTDIPVAIHLQGILSAIYEAWLPQNLSWRDFIIRNPRTYFGYNALQKSVPREKEILRHCKYLMGRTDWDRSLAGLLAPDATYFHCDEMLRPEIYAASEWAYHNAQPIVITSIISNAVYKGSDVILRVASILKRETDLNFLWKVYGVQDFRLAERLTGIRAETVNVVAMGSADVSKLVEELQTAAMFVHPSYIENSSNAICEAQCIGVPVIATHVGGTTTLVDDEKTGIVVPANDPYLTAAQIVRLVNNPELCTTIGQQARLVARERHNPQKIVADIIRIYNSILHASI